MLFLFRSAAPWGPPLGLFSEIAGTPLPPPPHLPLPDLYKTQVRKCVAFPSNHRHLNATINGGVLQLKESDAPPHPPRERWFTFLFNGSQTRRCNCTEQLLRLTVYLSTPPPPVSPHSSVYAFLPCNLVFFFLFGCYMVDFTCLPCPSLALPRKAPSLSRRGYTPHFICAGKPLESFGSRNTRTEKLLNKSFQYALCLGEVFAALLNHNRWDGKATQKWIFYFFFPRSLTFPKDILLYSLSATEDKQTANRTENLSIKIKMCFLLFSLLLNIREQNRNDPQSKDVAAWEALTSISVFIWAFFLFLLAGQGHQFCMTMGQHSSYVCVCVCEREREREWTFQTATATLPTPTIVTELKQKLPDRWTHDTKTYAESI